MEIKFRIWDIETKQFFYWRLTESYPTCLTKKYVYCTTQLFTGLVDKKGHEIYEGDIVMCDNCIPNRNQPFTVEFRDGIFGVHDHIGCLTPLYIFSEWCHMYIVGNIYENQN